MDTPRNIILLVADSLRYDAVHGAGPAASGLPWTLANGVTFTQARSAGCWTLPATGSLFTGRFPHEHGADAQTRALPREVPTLAERLAEVGYHPHQVTANVVTTDVFGLDRGFESVQRTWTKVPARHTFFDPAFVLMSKPRVRKKLLDPKYLSGQMSQDVEAARVWLQDTASAVLDDARRILAEEEARGHRSFLFVNVMEAHFPYHVADTFETLADTPWGAAEEIWSLFHLVNQTWLATGEQPLTSARLARLRERQRRAWQRLAARIDAFIEEMHAAGNLVVFCADHGDTFGEDDWVYHFSNVSEGGNRVPLHWVSPSGARPDFWGGGGTAPSATPPPRVAEDRAAPAAPGAGGPHRIDVPISTRDVFEGILWEAGHPAARFHPVLTPEESLSVLQSVWYGHAAGTLPQYRMNQLCLVEGGARWRFQVSCRERGPVHPPAAPGEGRWARSELSDGTGAEPGWETLDAGVDPLEEGVFLPERARALRHARDGFVEYARKLED